jgi:hypothetical protein
MISPRNSNQYSLSEPAYSIMVLISSRLNCLARSILRLFSQSFVSSLPDMFRLHYFPNNWVFLYHCLKGVFYGCVVANVNKRKVLIM